MQTTIDLPPAVHARALELAEQQHKTLSEIITECVQEALGRVANRAVLVGTTSSGWPIVSLGRPVTAEDVRSLEDEW